MTLPYDYEHVTAVTMDGGLYLQIELEPFANQSEMTVSQLAGAFYHSPRELLVDLLDFDLNPLLVMGLYDARGPNEEPEEDDEASAGVGLDPRAKACILSEIAAEEGEDAFNWVLPLVGEDTVIIGTPVAAALWHVNHKKRRGVVGVALDPKELTQATKWFGDLSRVVDELKAGYGKWTNDLSVFQKTVDPIITLSNLYEILRAEPTEPSIGQRWFEFDNSRGLSVSLSSGDCTRGGGRGCSEEEPWVRCLWCLERTHEFCWELSGERPTDPGEDRTRPVRSQTRERRDEACWNCGHAEKISADRYHDLREAHGQLKTAGRALQDSWLGAIKSGYRADHENALKAKAQEARRLYQREEAPAFLCLLAELRPHFAARHPVGAMWRVLRDLASVMSSSACSDDFFADIESALDWLGSPEPQQFPNSMWATAGSMVALGSKLGGRSPGPSSVVGAMISLYVGGYLLPRMKRIEAAHNLKVTEMRRALDVAIVAMRKFARPGVITLFDELDELDQTNARVKQLEAEYNKARQESGARIRDSADFDDARFVQAETDAILKNGGPRQIVMPMLSALNCLVGLYQLIDGFSKDRPDAEIYQKITNLLQMGDFGLSLIEVLQEWKPFQRVISPANAWPNRIGGALGVVSVLTSSLQLEVEARRGRHRTHRACVQVASATLSAVGWAVASSHIVLGPALMIGGALIGVGFLVHELVFADEVDDLKKRIWAAIYAPRRRAWEQSEALSPAMKARLTENILEADRWVNDTVPSRIPGPTLAPNVFEMSMAARPVQLKRVRDLFDAGIRDVKTITQLLKSDSSVVASMTNRQYVYNVLVQQHRLIAF